MQLNKEEWFLLTSKSLLFYFLDFDSTFFAYLFQSIQQQTAMNVRAWGEKFATSFAHDIYSFPMSQ